jgi:hypothetical protein
LIEKKKRVQFEIQEQERRAKEAEVVTAPTTQAELASMINQVHDLLQDGQETVTGALNRLARERRASKSQSKSKEKKSTPTVVGLNEFKVNWQFVVVNGIIHTHLLQKPIAVPAAASGPEDDFDRLTRLSDRLLHEGTHSIYEMRQRDLKDILNAKKRTAKIWQYVIRGAKEDGSDSEIFGPFSSDQMLQWTEFLSQQGNVDVRLTIGKKREWRPIATVDINKELDLLN